MPIGSIRQSTEERCPYCGSELVKARGSGGMYDCQCGEEFRMIGAGKADVIYPGTEDGASSLGRYLGTLGQASVRSPTGKGVVYPPRADALGHETGGQSDSDAPAPDSQDE